MIEKPVSDDDLKKLRSSGLITQKEVAFVSGDVVIAENVITRERRVLNTGSLLLETTRRILKG
jgi:hypothetical protein|tara:strand:- start:639 stop:827 length:189 start_codon:yes stop_codon:yes gene_type:complete